MKATRWPLVDGFCANFIIKNKNGYENDFSVNVNFLYSYHPAEQNESGEVEILPMVYVFEVRNGGYRVLGKLNSTEDVAQLDTMIPILTERLVDIRYPNGFFKFVGETP